MKRIFPPRKRPRAAVRSREEQPTIDLVAFALAIWLSVLVGAQLIQRAPDLPQLATAGPWQPVNPAAL
jgi:hypothetical protein